MKSGLVSMVVLQDKRVLDHFQSGIENGLIALRLPEFDIEPILRIADFSVCFCYLGHRLVSVIQSLAREAMRFVRL